MSPNIGKACVKGEQKYESECDYYLDITWWLKERVN